MKRIHVLWGLAALLAMGLIGCLEIPLGDPETSKIDDQFMGAWINQGQNETSDMITMMPFDARAYLVTQMRYVKTDAGYQPRGLSTSKGWLTKIGDATFITIEPKDPKSVLEEHAPLYFVARITRDGDKVTLQSVDNQFVKDNNATTPAALAKLIQGNLQNPKLFETETATYAKATGDTAEKAKMIMDAFGEPKQQNASTEQNGTGL